MTTTSPDSHAPPDEEARFFARYRRDRDAATREQLVARHLPLARHLARRSQARAKRDALEQVASIALLKAIDRFDPERGLAFSTFAVPTVLGELKRYFRDFGWGVHVPRPIQELKLRLDAEAPRLGAELGRAPTARELAEHLDTTVEAVVEAFYGGQRAPSGFVGPPAIRGWRCHYRSCRRSG